MSVGIEGLIGIVLTAGLVIILVFFMVFFPIKIFKKQKGVRNLVHAQQSAEIRRVYSGMNDYERQEFFGKLTEKERNILFSFLNSNSMALSNDMLITGKIIIALNPYSKGSWKNSAETDWILDENRRMMQQHQETHQQFQQQFQQQMEQQQWHDSGMM